MPYKVKGKCIYKKDGGAKIGCTKGSVKKYLAALHANANESIIPVNPMIGTCNGFDFSILSTPITEENVLKGGKADKIRTIEALYDYWATKGYAAGGISKSLKKELEHEITLGKKIEREHTSDEEKIIEIVFDHLVEDKNYYTNAKPKDWAEKEISQEVNEDTKNLIKRLIRENIGSGTLSEDYFKRRIPFLQEFNFFNNDNRIFAQKVSFHKNVKKMFNGELLWFPQFNVSSEFIYYTHKVHDNVFHNFILKNKFHPMQPSNMDDLTFKVFNLAMNQVEEKLSFSHEIMVKEGHHINSAELDEVINKINERMFKVEHVSSENNTALFKS